jgi:hypothetical protein
LFWAVESLFFVNLSLAQNFVLNFPLSFEIYFREETNVWQFYLASVGFVIMSLDISCEASKKKKNLDFFLKRNWDF